ncbi:GtrA family protein [Blastococcus sp. CT_GayMR16]|uniref:GtrA family protein n=1 Tax=Blastococcus sp. CT_GayMR16 TaxID=2559607 RepID=UPI001FD80E93|nr:GtrA family protein [Blastococcus sp. CT_GayMR16]
MTCPSLLRYRPAAAEFFGDVSHARHLRRGVALFQARLRRDDIIAQFGRFVLVGGSSTAVYGLLFISLGALGYLPAHLIATVASSILANEMHRRLTFRAEERVNWLNAQLEAGGVALVGLLATSAALGWLNSSAGSAHVILQISLVAAITAAIGIMRFVALRWIFRPTELSPAR